MDSFYAPLMRDLIEFSPYNLQPHYGYIKRIFLCKKKKHIFFVKILNAYFFFEDMKRILVGSTCLVLIIKI